MRYLISDIHGCYKEYRELLEKIKFTDKDKLFVLGDAVDRGPEPIRVLKDLMQRPNVTYLAGNHDHMMIHVLEKLMVEITEENWSSHLTENDLLNYVCWKQNGGEVTLHQFTALSREEQEDILDYLKDGLLYEVLEEKDQKFVLVHAGIWNFEENKRLDEYDFMDFLYERADYKRRYYQDEKVYLVTGHTPTPLIREDKKPLIYQENGHIAIDCGCVFGGNLAAYCIETGQAVYVEKKR